MPLVLTLIIIEDEPAAVPAGLAKAIEARRDAMASPAVAMALHGSAIESCRQLTKGGWTNTV